MIEILLESALCAQFSALGLEGVGVNGFWQPASAGEVKGREGANFKALVDVAVSPRGFETFTTPKAVFSAAVVIVVRRDLCPTGAELSAFVEPVLELLQTWQTDLAAVKSVFTVAGFVPSGFKLDPGVVNSDQGKTAWTITHTIAIRGVITHERNINS